MHARLCDVQGAGITYDGRVLHQQRVAHDQARVIQAEFTLLRNAFLPSSGFGPLDLVSYGLSAGQELAGFAQAGATSVAQTGAAVAALTAAPGLPVPPGFPSPPGAALLAVAPLSGAAPPAPPLPPPPPLPGPASGAALPGLPAPPGPGLSGAGSIVSLPGSP